MPRSRRLLPPSREDSNDRAHTGSHHSYSTGLSDSEAVSWMFGILISLIKFNPQAFLWLTADHLYSGPCGRFCRCSPYAPQFLQKPLCINVDRVVARACDQWLDFMVHAVVYYCVDHVGIPSAWRVSDARDFVNQ